MALALSAAAALVSGAQASPPGATVASALRAARSPAAELSPVRTADLPGGATVRRYQQRIGGVPVLGAQAVVLQAASGAASLVTDATSASAGRVEKADTTTDRISRSRAIGIARSAGRVLSLRDPASAALAIDPGHGDALVWRVVLPAARPLKDLEVLVDATSGGVISKVNLLEYATGHAKLYDPNPPAMNGGYSDLGMTKAADHSDHDTAKLTALRVGVKLPRIKSGQHCLKGKYVRALLHTSGTPVCRKSLDWRGVTRSDDRFEALMAYFHIDRTQAYLQSLGFHHANNRRTTVRVDFKFEPGMGQDNSFYSPADKTIRYGAGGVDDAEDGDVVTHEYGHAIEDNQVHGYGNCNNCLQANSLGEGWGDYVSAMMTAQSAAAGDVPGGYLNHAMYCIFDWDGVVGWGGPLAEPCGRVANGSDGISTYPDAVANCGVGPNGDPHCYGEVWTHGLLDLRGALGNDGSGHSIVDEDLISSQFFYQQNETFSQAVGDLAKADDVNYGNGTAGSGTGPHIGSICNEMVGQRGFTPPLGGPCL